MRFNKLIPALIVATAIPLTSLSASKKSRAPLPEFKLEVIRDLKISGDAKPKSQDFISAASGLIKLDDRYYIVSDTDSYLFSFSESEAGLNAFQVLDVNVTDPQKKKVEKADFESLTALNSEQWPPHGAIVIWPSASKPERMRAVTVPLTAGGKLNKPIVSNISPLAHQILPHAKELNIEGILVEGKNVFFFQRGNTKNSKNGIAEIALVDFIKGLKTSEWTGKLKFETIKVGSLDGTKLGFSDAVSTSYGLLTLATAEDTETAVGDGRIIGTVLAKVTGKKTEILGKFEPRTKLEGISVQETNEGLDIYVVEDADSIEKPSRLFKTRISKQQLEAIKPH